MLGSKEELESWGHEYVRSVFLKFSICISGFPSAVHSQESIDMRLFLKKSDSNIMAIR